MIALGIAFWLACGFSVVISYCKESKVLTLADIFIHFPIWILGGIFSLLVYVIIFDKFNWVVWRRKE